MVGARDGEWGETRAGGGGRRSVCGLGRFVDGTFKGAESVPLWYNARALEQSALTSIIILIYWQR